MHLEQDRRHSLAIGYGNLDRGDDGAAFHVVNRLRRLAGLRELLEDEERPADLGMEAAVFLPQLVPELALEAAAYECIVLVDAHVAAERRPLVCLALEPHYPGGAFSHQLEPAMFLWLVQAVGGRRRTSYLVSLRGHDFEPRRGLSRATAALVNPAAEKVLALMRSGRAPGASPYPKGGMP